MGFVDGDSIVYERAFSSRAAVIAPAAPATPVDIVHAWAGADSRLLDASAAVARGVVVAGMGRGNVPPEMVPGIERLIAKGTPVVLTTRVGSGAVGTQYGYEGATRRLADAGVILGGARRPTQARIDLMLGLGAGLDPKLVFRSAVATGE